MNRSFEEPGPLGDEQAAMPYDPDDDAGTQDGIAGVISRQEKELLPVDGIEGIGAGRDPAGHDALVVYVRDQSVASAVPEKIDGYPVEIVVTGQISAY
jgi:hypothetical protein